MDVWYVSNILPDSRTNERSIQSFAASFAKAGPKGIVLVARSEGALLDVSKEIKAINSEIEVLAVPTDLFDEASVKAMWAKVKAKFGHADILVNNAGTFDQGGAIADAPASNWWSDFVSSLIRKLQIVLTENRKSMCGEPS